MGFQGIGGIYICMLIYQKMVWLKIAWLSTLFKSLLGTILCCGAQLSQWNPAYTFPALVYLHLSSFCGHVKSVCFVVIC